MYPLMLSSRYTYCNNIASLVKWSAAPTRDQLMAFSLPLSPANPCIYYLKSASLRLLLDQILQHHCFLNNNKSSIIKRNLFNLSLLIPWTNLMRESYRCAICDGSVQRLDLGFSPRWSWIYWDLIFLSYFQISHKNYDIL
jgi:hypothetical protein